MPSTSTLFFSLLWIFLFFSQSVFAQNASQSSIINKAPIEEQAIKKKQSLRFSKNIGQIDQSVLYHVNDLQADHYFMANEIRTVLQHTNESSPTNTSKSRDNRNPQRSPHEGQEESRNSEDEQKSQTIYSYGLSFLGTAGPERLRDLRPEIVQSIGKKNYIKGQTRFTDIPQYGQVQYQSLWQGIDVDFYENKGHLKYDFVVAPFADPSLIQFRMNGVSNIYVDGQTGELTFLTPFGELKKGMPFTYQIIEGKKIEIASSYEIKNGVISFKLGSYDQSKTLIIDPIALKFATFLGGNSDDEIYDIYVHPISKKIYLTGVTKSSSFPGITGTAVSNTSSNDGFISCMSKDGSSVLWTTIIGGDEGSDYLYKIYVSDDEDNIFVSGHSNSDDYPTDGTLSPFSTNLAGSSNPVISRLNGDGTQLKYSTYFPVTSYALERYTVVGDLVYGATYYDDNDANNYPISMPEGAYLSTPPHDSMADEGQIFFAINTSLAGDSSFQYGTFWYDTTADSYSYLEFMDSDSDGDGNIYFGGYLDIGEPSYGPKNLFPDAGIQSVDELHTILGSDGTYSPVGWVAQFDPTLSNLMYATPYAPVAHNEYMEVAQYDYLFEMEVSDNGDIYTIHPNNLNNVSGLNQLVVAPTAKYNNLQPLKLESSGDDLLLNIAAKIASSDRTQFEYIVTAASAWNSTDPIAGGKLDSQGRLHWVFSKNKDEVILDALATEGALQDFAISGYQCQYVILTPGGDLEYSTIVGPSVDFSTSKMDVFPNASFISDDGTFYIGGSIETDAQKSFPVTTSYWDAETGSQVFVHDATPSNNTEAWLAVFHEPTPTSNVINDFTVGNDSFCVNGLIYQDPNYGPILGDPIGFQSGDGSSATHVLPDIRPTAFTEAHPEPSGADALQWEISRDNGASWVPLSNSSAEVYKPKSESIAGTVQYRRVYTYGLANTQNYSNIATATISGSFGLDLQSPEDLIYFCPGTVEDFSFPISGASGNIDWQWYDGFAPLGNTAINPATGTDTPANFQATIPSTASQGSYYRLVVEDATACAAEVFITTAPLSDAAGSNAILSICPGDASNEVQIGPSTPNPDFEYSWTGPSSFTSNQANPVVSVDGTYYLQVRLVGDPTFCAGGQTSVDILPLAAHDTVLVDTSINLAFCQSDAPIAIGLSGPAPSGYLFQWSPAISLDDPTFFNPTFYPGTMAFGPPSSSIEYRFTAIRVSDGCVFEDTIYTSTLALAQAKAGQSKNAVCQDSVTIGGASSGEYFEWRAIETTFPGGLAALTSTSEFAIDDVPVNLGTSKFAEIKFPIPDSIPYTIEFELQSSYVPLSNSCFSADTVQLAIFPCTAGNGSVCPDITTTNSQGSAGVCDLTSNVLEVNEIPGGTYEWTTYAVDGVIQSAGTPPRGLFNTDGSALSAAGPHPTEVKTDLEDPSWGWAGAFSVEYQVSLSILIDDSLQSCSDRIIVYSSVVGTPVVDIKEMDVCFANAPATLLIGTGKNLPYQLTGIDYNTAPNSNLKWSWSGGPVNSDGSTPFPTIEPTETTPYVVMVTDTVTGCFNIDTFKVRLHSLVVNTGPDLSTACTGSVVQIGTNAKSGLTYQWTPASGLNFPIGTANSTVAKPYLTIPGTPTEYSLIATQTSTGCQATDTVLITPETNAPSAPSAANYTSCPDGELVIGTSYSPSSGITFSWTAGAGANLSWLDNTTINQPTLTLPSNFTGPATFTLSVSNGTCGSASANYTISSQVADVELGPDVTALCQTPYVAIGSASKTAGYKYLWSPTNGLFTDAAGTIPYTNQDINTVYAKPNTNTQYTLIASNAITGCLSTDNITVNAPTGIDVDAGDDKVLCPEESAITIGQSGSGTISWNAIGYDSDPTNSPSTPSTADSTTMMSYLSSLNSATVSFSQGSYAAGIYQYQVSADYGGGCIATDEVILTVSDLPTGLAGSAKTLCAGESVELGVASVSGVNYVWTILNPSAASGTISDTRSPNPSVNPTENTSYSLSYTDISTGCELTEVVSITIAASPNIADVSMGPFCDPIAAQNLVAQIPDYGTLTSATWYIDYEGGPIESTPTAVQPSRTTEYFLLATNANSCSDLAKITVSLESPQTPSIIPSADVDCNTGLVDLADFEGVPTDPSYSLEWHNSNDTNPASLISNTVVGKGVYYLFETTPNGCASNSDSILVTDASCPTPFPVEWLEFTVDQAKSDALVKWSTASEANTDYYIVERSVDGILFMSLGSIRASGTTNEVNQYQLIDDNVIQMGQGKLFYRIRQVDLDGKFDHSNIVQLDLTGIESMLSWMNASPVPADESLIVNYQLINTPTAKLKIVNTLGAQIYRKDILKSQGKIDIDVNALPSGYYYLSLEGENGKSVIKFQVRH